MSDSSYENSHENGSSGGSSTPSDGTMHTSSTMTLQKAVDLGEYNPDYLATFPEWHTLSKHVQWQMLKKAIDTRENQLVHQWAEVANTTDFSKKPQLQEALKNIQDQRHKVLEDKDRLIVEYSTG